MAIVVLYKGAFIAPGPEGMLLGRGSTARLKVGHPSVSRNHCFIRDSHGCLRVRDLGNSNGTFVNGKRLRDRKAASVQPGDILQLGDVELRVLEHHGPTDCPDLVAPAGPDEAMTASRIYRPEAVPDLSPLLHVGDDSDVGHSA